MAKWVPARTSEEGSRLHGRQRTPSATQARDGSPFGAEHRRKGRRFRVGGGASRLGGGAVVLEREGVLAGHGPKVHHLGIRCRCAWESLGGKSNGALNTQVDPDSLSNQREVWSGRTSLSKRCSLKGRAARYTNDAMPKLSASFAVGAAAAVAWLWDECEWSCVGSVHAASSAAVAWLWDECEWSCVGSVHAGSAQSSAA